MLSKAGLRLLFLLALSFPQLTAATENPQRIISLAPHLTEAVYWLGAGDRLVGRDRFSNYPTEALTVPTVGDAYNLNIEALLAKKPDLVLLWQAPASLKQQMERYGLAIFNTNPQSIDESRDELARLAERLAVTAELAFAELDATIATLKPNVDQQKKAIILVQAQPPVSLGLGDTLATSLKHCGWQNAFTQPQAVINVSPEYLAVGDYDAAILFTSKPPARLKKVPVFKPAADPLVRPGPRFPAAMLELCEALKAAL